MTRRSLVFGLAALTASCFQYREETTVMPDGAGKIELTAAIRSDVYNPENGHPPFTVAELAQTADGIVAWSEPIVEERDEYRFVRMTGYFQDLNAVRLYYLDPPRRQPWKTFHWERRGEGYHLWVEEHFWAGDADNEHAPTPHEKVEETRHTWRGMEWSLRVTLPGPVTEVSGFEREGERVVVAHFGVDDLLAGRWVPPRLDASCGASVVSTSQVAAFREEIGRAIQTWDRLRRRSEDR